MFLYGEPLSVPRGAAKEGAWQDTAGMLTARLNGLEAEACKRLGIPSEPVPEPEPENSDDTDPA